MFVLELAFSDTPERHQARPAHRERMAALNEQGKVLASGPWTDDAGALVVLLVDSVAEAREIVNADPYFTTAGVQVVSLQQWDAVVRHPALQDV